VEIVFRWGADGEFFIGEIREIRGSILWLRLCRAGLLAAFRGYFIVFHPADSAVMSLPR
jgi:hypothetical protein